MFRLTGLRWTAAMLAVVVGLTCCGGGVANVVTPSRSSISTGTSTEGFLTYSNGDVGFSMRYPSDWEKLEGQFGVVVLFRSPTDGTSDQFRENVNLVTENVPSGVTIDDYARAGLSSLPNVITDFDLVSSEPATLAGQSAHVVVYTGRQGTSELKFQQTFTLISAKAFVLTYVAERDQFDRYHAVAQAIIDSFRPD